MEFEGVMVLAVHPFEIGAPGTPGMSLGTKILSSKIFSYHKNMMLFYAFFHFILQKMPKFMENLFMSDLLLGKKAPNH